MKNFLIVLGIISIPALLIGACVGFGKPYAKWHAEWSNDIKQGYKIQDANVRIQSYEWFYDQYNAIKAQQKKVSVISDAKEKESAMLILYDMIGEYNSRASMSMTKAKWKPIDLPYEVVIGDVK